MRRLVLFAPLLLCACVSRIGDVTLVTTKNIGQQIDLSKAKNMGEFEGVDAKQIIIIIPTGVPSAEDAIDRALAEGQGQVMTDAVIYSEWFYIPYLFGESKLRVKGTVWQIEGLPIPKAPVKQSSSAPSTSDLP